MTALSWVLISSAIMYIIALVTSVILLLKLSSSAKFNYVLQPFAAGTLLCAAFFYMLPSISAMHLKLATVGMLIVVGFFIFLNLKQFTRWQHAKQLSEEQEPHVTFFMFLEDGLHSFWGGMTVGSAFIIDTRLGLICWIAVVSNEMTQQAGNYNILVDGGWTGKSALFFNVVSSSPYVLGCIAIYSMSLLFDVSWFLPLAVGHFIYNGSMHLMSQINQHKIKPVFQNAISLSAFFIGSAVFYALLF